MVKRLIYLIPAILLLAAACQPDDIDYGTGAVKREYRIKTFDNYTFAYNDDGTVARITTTGRTISFEYSGKSLSISNGDAVEYKINLNKDGFATKIERSGHTWTIDYNKAGYMTKVSLDGVQATSQSVSSNNIQYWTDYDLSNDFWRKNEASYLPKANVGLVQTDWVSTIGLERWLFEARLLGNTSANVLESSRWTNAGGKDKNTSVYDYEYDANGCIVMEIKYYGEWNDFDLDGLSRLESHTFTWEAIPQP
ncbi:MAG: DUF4595 domain-containing protein [Bacteroidales bacterium]|nr:DUF4595 domain-containing protein [Bacteroidales bacterium]